MRSTFGPFGPLDPWTLGPFGPFGPFGPLDPWTLGPFGLFGPGEKMRNKFFDKYPLISLKRVNYLLFKQIVSIMQLKEHNNLEGLLKIINIRAT